MKKKILLTFLIIIAIFGIFIYYKNYYSLEKVKTILVEGDVLPENITIIETYFNDNNEQIAHIDTYIKDNIIYTIQYDNTHKYAESLTNKNYDTILIVHDTKNIIHESKNESDVNPKMSENFFRELNLNSVYKYHGKTQIDNTSCIKVSLSTENVDNIQLAYYYIDLENKHIIKEEIFSGSSINNATLKNSVTYKYICNSVEDNDILTFDKNNYQDYTYTEL